MDNSQNPIRGGNQSGGGRIDEAWYNRDRFALMPPDEKRQFVYTYQPPREDQIPKFIVVQKALLEAAKVVEENCPSCADRSHALRLLRDVRMWANAAIALDGVV